MQPAYLVSDIDGIKTGAYSRGDANIVAGDTETLIHEIGHYIDNSIEEYSSPNTYYSTGSELGNYFSSRENAGFIQRIKNKYNMNKVASEIKKARKAYIDPSDGYVDYAAFEKDGYCALSDIYDAIYKGKIYDNCQLSGHGQEYYSNINRCAKETFANYFQLRVQDNTKALSMLKRTNPDLAETLENMYTDVANRMQNRGYI